MAITVYTYNDKVLKNVATDKWLKKYDPYNPLGLPPLTIRVKLKDGASLSINNATCTQVSSSPNIWDVSTQTGEIGNNWTRLCRDNSDLTEVLGINPNGNGTISNVTDMSYLFYGCTNLTTVPLFDTSSVTNMNMMFGECYKLASVPLLDTSNVTDMSAMLNNCNSLTSIPLFNTSKAINMSNMCYGCIKVESGALALYQQASSQTTPPSFYNYCFRDCGSNTVTGAAELAQIPSSWGGTGA